MSPPQVIVIFGASARSAAFSALRAGLRPWCADLFADQDLITRCSIRRLHFRDYPHGFKAISTQAPSGPWIYTGGLENHPTLIERISEKRLLWGNGSAALSLARSSMILAEIFRTNGILFPATFSSTTALPRVGRWLVKPLKGAGGMGVRFFDLQKERRPGKQFYFQEYTEGVPCSAVFVGFEHNTRLLSVTRQLVGEHWLHAAPFHYCGSIGPLKLEAAVQKNLETIGIVLNRYCHLRGLFGVDFILADGIPWPVEVNPRYPASIEILEYGAGIQALAWHRAAFDPASAIPPGPTPEKSVVGKAILFAKRQLDFPEEGPWTHSLGHPKSIDEMPAFADIPSSGQTIEAGRPILTFFSRSGSVSGSLDNLKQIAWDLDHWLQRT
jgi:predicted ATP-grasp superfamily ATP-dependent carboligase